MKKILTRLLALVLVNAGLISVALATGPTSGGGLPKP